MCYQVVERYSVCRCLYYKHTIDVCAAHGQRGHVVQEKITLVGYSCSSHSSAGQVGNENDPEPFESDSDDDTEGNRSIFSEALISKTSTLVTTSQEEEIDRILGALVDDPLLPWPDLLSKNQANQRQNNVKDVRFFLRAFERSLRESANTILEAQVCSFIRHRIPYLSARIYEHFNFHRSSNFSTDDIPENRADKTETWSKAIGDMDPEYDHAFIPSFDTIRGFLFDGQPFDIMKENLRNYVRNNIGFNREIQDVLSKEIGFSRGYWTRVELCFNPSRLTLRSLGKNRAVLLSAVFDTFLQLLQHEAITSKISVDHIEGLQDLDAVQIERHFIQYWARPIPQWHYTPLEPGKNSSLKLGCLDSGLELSRGAEEFRTFLKSTISLTLFQRMMDKFLDDVDEKPTRSFGQWKLPWGNYSKRAFMSHASNGANMVFICVCNTPIQDNYTENKAGGIRKFQNLLNSYTAVKRYGWPELQTALSQPAWKIMPDLFFRGSKQRSSSATLPSHQPRPFNASPQNDTSCTSHVSSDPGGHTFIHPCLPYSLYLTRMEPLQACNLTCDSDFFHAMRWRYYGSKSRFQIMLSFKKPVAITFVKFTLYQKQIVDVHERDQIPPESLKDEYVYTPMPADTIPPIGSNLLLHFFENPDHAPPNLTLLPRIPKRKPQKLEPCPIRGSSVGWGLQIVTGIDQLKLFLFGLVASILSMVFGVTWTLVRGDIQGGFGVAGFMLTFFFFAIGSLKALNL
ncbi:hypothetical protein BS50DRAFT_570896 [Corynespora cassiicola Philippines]|uniref:Uncharacterized protein n=1 Tax=Corynespora cassiicola Philippines TaxID=1448308 RepID=A0A2T2P2K0_CORCC|nr:hypothetical protein BS50DRAFT_570896 [Corynespora cassiicola Philippines]